MKNGNKFKKGNQQKDPGITKLFHYDTIHLYNLCYCYMLLLLLLSYRYIPPLTLPPGVTWSWREAPESGLEGRDRGWACRSAPEGGEGWTLQGRAKRSVSRICGWRLATDQPSLLGQYIPNFVQSLTWCERPRGLNLAAQALIFWAQRLRQAFSKDQWGPTCWQFLIC